MIVVRPMAAEYLEAVLSLEVATPEAPHWGRVAYERVLSADSKTAGRRAAWVALDGHELQGFAAAHLIVDVCELELIVVAESARRQGIGTILLDAVMTWALASRARKLDLEVRAGNESAICFYLKAGMLREGLRRGYYRNPEEDAILMGKSLYSGD